MNRTKYIVVGLILVFFLAFAALRSVRENRFRVTKEMNWECAPDSYMPAYPDAQPVRFRYLENPRYEEVVFGRGLCDQLKNNGKPVVPVEYELWGDRINGLRGFSEIAVDGKPIVNAGGMGSSGDDGSPAPHPLQSAFEQKLNPRR
ncbi:MAG: hypothetical protein ACRETL_17145 [Gammaproteobacteria bacterium]